MKEHMLEALKRKRSQIQYESDSKGPHAGGQSEETGDEELAPVGGSAKHDAMLGKPGGHNSSADAESESESENQNAMGEGGDGFQDGPDSHASAPKNSRSLFQDPKKDTHDEVDPNMHRNMAGDGGGLETKYDDMGVDVHKDVRSQSSHMAKHNMGKAEALKHKEAGLVGRKTQTDLHDPGKGEDAHDAVAGDNEKMQGYGPMKKARSKLDSFIGSLKR